MLLGTMTVFAMGPNELAQKFGFKADYCWDQETYTQFNISEEEMQAAREEGLTLRELALEKGLEDEFYEGLVARHEARIGYMVERGQITIELAEDRLAQIKERIASGLCEEPIQQRVMQNESLQNKQNLNEARQNRMGNKR